MSPAKYDAEKIKGEYKNIKEFGVTGPKTKTADFSYYKPLPGKQQAFHNSNARHKLLMGGVGAGKTYPAIHEAFFIAYENPNHNFYIFRSNWDDLKDNIEDPMVEVSTSANAHRYYDKANHDLYLWNGTVMRFRPLSLGKDLKRAISKMKGAYMCGFLIDDPDIKTYWDFISYLFTRLRDPPTAKAKYVATVWTANWEGHDQLWQTFIKDKNEGINNNGFAYWVLNTRDNETLGDNYIKDMEAIHSKQWVDRYIHNKMTSKIGLIYQEFKREIHVIPYNKMPFASQVYHILCIDVGITDPTVLTDIICDKSKVYINKVWYKTDVRIGIVGDKILEWMDEINFYRVLIDPSAHKREQTSGRSIFDILKKDFGIPVINANNDLLTGIELVKSLLTVRGTSPKLFFNTGLEETYSELEVYRWKEQTGSLHDDLAYKEEPFDKNNHVLDTIRYGIIFLAKTLMRGMFRTEDQLKKRRDEAFMERINKLKMYRENGGYRAELIARRIDEAKLRGNATKKLNIDLSLKDLEIIRGAINYEWRAEGFVNIGKLVTALGFDDDTITELARRDNFHIRNDGMWCK